MRRPRLVGPAIAEVSRWVPTLSLDEPHLHRLRRGVQVVDPRLFVAVEWLRVATQCALDPAYPIPTGEHPAGRREDSRDPAPPDRSTPAADPAP